MAGFGEYTKWSISKIKTINCPLCFKYKYVDKWKAIGKAPMAETDKGKALHETFELHKTGMTLEQDMANLERFLLQYPVNEDPAKGPVYKVRDGLVRFRHFWDQMVAPMEANGYKVYQEHWIYGTLTSKNPDGTSVEESFKGGMDLFLEGKDSAIIFDYKTPETMNTSYYEKQLIAYAYVYGKSRGWTVEEIPNKIKLYVFFPLGKITAKYMLESSPEQQALYCCKEITYDAAKVATIMMELQAAITFANNKDWNAEGIEADAVVDEFGCKFCDYIGAIENPETGFKGCPASYAAGKLQERGVKFVRK